MVDGNSSVKMMSLFAVGLVGLAAVTLVGIAVVRQYSTSGVLGDCSNATTQGTACTGADNFVTGLAIFATFSSVLAIAIIGKVIIGLFKGGF